MRLSYSALSMFQRCPRQFEAKYVTRTMPFVETEATRRGKMIHKALEACVRDGAEPPPSVHLPPNLLDLLRAGRAQAEYKIEINEPHFIGYLDVFMPQVRHALVIDWKTGKMRRVDPLQADVYAWLLREHSGRPDLGVTFGWVGVDSRKTVMVEPDLDAGKRVLDIVDTIHKTWGNWPPVESWACRYCPLTYCEHNAAS